VSGRSFHALNFHRFGQEWPYSRILRSETFPCAAFQFVLQAGKLVLFVNGETTTQSLGVGGTLGGGMV
jgi:hypothetical protein